MTKQQVLDEMKRIGVVPVLRASSVDAALAMARAIAAGGVTVLEITMTVPDAVSVIRTLVKESPEILMGAGTVLDAETARACVAEGARFIVSPSTDLGTIEYCRANDIAVMPGALTPTEIVAAWRAGADVVKVFPASSVGGASYIKSVRAPLPQIPLMPSGGVTIGTAADFLEAGAWAIGAGSDLANEKAIAEGKPEALTEAARAYREIVLAYQWKTQKGVA